MDKKALYNLLGKYLSNTCTLEEQELVDNWLDLLQEDKTFAAYTKNDLDTIHHRIWQKIQAQTYQKNEIEKPADFVKRSRFTILTRWAVAASIAAIIAFVGFRTARQYASSKDANSFASIIPASGMLKEKNSTAVPLKKLLEDNSVVVLEPGATLNYPVHFLADKREVYLEGKAFFEVSKNAKRPFYIYHNHLITHVIGTSFTINTCRQDKEAEVVVFTGRVEVSENARLVTAQSHPKMNGVILTPNQKVLYKQDSRSFTSSLVDKPLPVKGQEASTLVFNNNEIGQVLSAISRQYAVELVSENDNINKCTFTGDISKPDLFTKLDIICKAINATYELKETKILIKGIGCE